MADVKFNVVKDLGSFAERNVKKIDFKTKESNEVHQTLKLQLGTWGNGKTPKFDIRPWNDDGSCEKGITLSPDELFGLYNLLTEVVSQQGGNDNE